LSVIRSFIFFNIKYEYNITLSRWSFIYLFNLFCYCKIRTWFVQCWNT